VSDPKEFGEAPSLRRGATGLMGRIAVVDFRYIAPAILPERFRKALVELSDFGPGGFAVQTEKRICISP
jgi:hypothetical protein